MKCTFFIRLMLIILSTIFIGVGGGEAFAQFTGGNSDGHPLVSKTDIAVCTLPIYSNVSTGGNADGHALVSKTDAAICTLPSYSNVSTGGNADGHAILNSACLSVTGIPTLLTATVTSTNTCSGQCTGAATAAATGGSSPYTYSWNSTPVQTTKTATGLCAGSYSVSVTDKKGNAIVQPATIIQSAALIITDSSVPDTCGHNKGTASVMLSGGTSPFTYSWDAAAGGQVTPTAVGLATGNYSVTVTDSMGCAQTHTVIVTSTSGFTVTISASSSTLVSGDSTQITASGGNTYLWSPSTGLSDSAIANPMARPTQTTQYCVTVTNTAIGCVDSSCMTVTVTTIQTTCDPYIPNAFSPNADGQNDFLKVHGDCIKELSLSIYDRWGEKVFETTDLAIATTKGWDGIYKGKLLNTAVFVYYFTATLYNETPIELTGNISLIR